MNICVYCGSSRGNDTSIHRQSEEFARQLSNKGHRLIYGGGSIGIMGILANTVIENGGEVIGVIPKDLFRKEVAHQGITELITVEDMHQRKSTMADLADAFVALPGGFGTLEELFEIITWNQIGIFKKPVVVLNLNGFFDPIIQMIEQAIDAGFIKPRNGEILNVAQTIEECFDLCGKANI